MALSLLYYTILPPDKEQTAVSRILGVFPASRNEHTHGKYPRSKDWGWRLENASYVPVMTDEEPTPDEVVKIIRCNCQLTLKNLSSGNSFLATLMVLNT